MGSLQTILENLQMKRDEKYNGVPTGQMCVGSVLGRVMTHKIALQVICCVSSISLVRLLLLLLI